MYIVHSHNTSLYTYKQTTKKERTEKRKRRTKGKYRKESAQLLTLGDEH